jgi:nucleotide-binding universal stress UspA family protein
MEAKRRREEAAELLSVSGPLGGKVDDSLFSQKEYDEGAENERLISLREKYESDVSSGVASLGDSKFALAVALVQSGRLSNVLSGVNLLVELHRNSFSDRNALYFLAVGLARLDKYGDARSYIEQLAKQEPENLQVKQLAELIEHRAQKQTRGRRVMVFLDGADSGVQAFFEALKLAKAGENGDTLYLVSVIESIDAFVDQTLFGWEAMLDEKKGELVESMQSDFVRWCEQANVRHVSVGGIGSAKDVLVQLADEENVDLLVIGHDHDASFFSKAFGTTVADHCLHHAPCHVIVAKDAGVLRQQRRERKAAAVPEPPRRRSVGPNSALAAAAASSSSASAPSPPRRRNLDDAQPTDEPLADTIMKSINSFASMFSFGDDNGDDDDDNDGVVDDDDDNVDRDSDDDAESRRKATASSSTSAPPPVVPARKDKNAPTSDKSKDVTKGPPPPSPAPEPPAQVEAEKKKFIQKIGVKLPFPGGKN